MLVPQINAKRPPLYSFADLVLLRTVVHLRADTSIQKIRKALSNLSDFDLNEHPSEYRFGTDGRTVVVWTDETFMDLVRNPGQMVIVTLADIYEPFLSPRGEVVVDFRRPREHLEVNPRRLGGWPTIEGSRIGFDTISTLMEGGDLEPEQVAQFYPTVSPAAVADAVDFAKHVKDRMPRRRAS